MYRDIYFLLFQINNMYTFLLMMKFIFLSSLNSWGDFVWTYGAFSLMECCIFDTVMFGLLTCSCFDYSVDILLTANVYTSFHPILVTSLLCFLLVETVKDLIRFLKREDETCDIRRQLGHAKIVQNDLLPILIQYKSEETLWETLVR